MRVNNLKAIELLSPVGNIESFYAALDGGADAIYLGLKNFNARNRAMNFTAWQVAAMVKEARKRNCKSYITLNTVIRNFELTDLLHTLFQLTQIQPDAVIVQDLGVLYLIKKYFSNLEIHASTQMAIHNSDGLQYARLQGIKRAVLARELTLNELKSISAKSNIEIELFVHGALCYSFSGMCLFSSYLGGASANRGMCTQPCRRLYKQKDEKGKKEAYFFSLKDNQLIDHIAEFKSMGIASLKIEGRLKPGEYVHRVTKAYRVAIDAPEKIDEAHRLLENDLGREKTSYFLGKDVATAITQAATTGILVGKVTQSVNGIISFTSNLILDNGCRLRFRNPQNDKQIDIKADVLTYAAGQYSIEGDTKEIKQTYEVYLAGNKLNMPKKLNTDGIKLNEFMSSSKISNISSSLKMKGNPQKREVFLRIDSFSWLEWIDPKDFTGIILQLRSTEWDELFNNKGRIAKFRHLLHAEFPKFIPEKKLQYYRDLAKKLFDTGINSFFVSHLSQKLLLPAQAKVSANENVYAFNDAAVRFLKEEGIQHFIYPLENDIANLGRGTDRNGIVPLFFFPSLFYSRMPVKLTKDQYFSDKNNERYAKHVRDGMTIITSEKPVSTTQYREKLERFGFKRFFVDVSFLNPSKENIDLIINSIKESASIKDSSVFNFKRELK